MKDKAAQALGRRRMAKLSSEARRALGLRGQEAFMEQTTPEDRSASARRAGKIGGVARATRMSPEDRSAAARRAACARRVTRSVGK